jgi:hypothetical protein
MEKVTRFSSRRCIHVSVITVIEGAVFKEFEGPRSKLRFAAPASVLA